MFVVRMDHEDVRKFRAFPRIGDARTYVRRHAGGDDAPEAFQIFEVPDTSDAEIAVVAVRDGLAIPVMDPEPDTAVILASMGLGTGLRI